VNQKILRFAAAAAADFYWPRKDGGRVLALYVINFIRPNGAEGVSGVVEKLIP